MGDVPLNTSAIYPIDLAFIFQINKDQTKDQLNQKRAILQAEPYF